MSLYVLKRLLVIIPTMFAVSLVVFGVLQMAPGDPALVLAGDDATEADIQAIRNKYSLDAPIYEQYATWVGQVVQGDLGMSLVTRRTVSEEIKSRAMPTLKLAALAILIAVVGGSAVGVIAARHRGGPFDYFSMIFALIGASMPAFWMGLILIMFFAVRLKWLPTGGDDGFKSLVLPAITLGMSSMAIIARMTRSSVLEVDRREYVRTARAKGLADMAVLNRHVLKNAFIPVLTVIGLQFGSLLAGTVVTETVFARPGLGRLLVTGIQSRDYPVVQGTLIVLALVLALVNLIIDLSYSLLDPRLRR